MTAGKAILSRLRAGVWAAVLLAHGALGGAAAPKRPSIPRKATPKKAAPGKTASRKPKAKAPAPRPEPLLHGEALVPFLEALRRTQEAGTAPVRVLHFGDSHTAADYWTGRIRERLQLRFGDGGPGLIAAGAPWRGYPHQGVTLVSGRKWEADGLRNPLGDGAVGLAGVSLIPTPGETFRLQAAFADFRIHTLDGDSGAAPACGFVEGFAQDPPPPIPLTVRSEWSLADGSRLRIRGTAEPLGLGRRELEVAMPPDARLLGIELFSGKPGVVYDELGLNGAELLDLERWSPELRGILLGQARPDLLVLAYGTNESGDGGLDLLDYRDRAAALLSALRRESGAPILVIGPLDRSSRYRRRRASLAVQERKVVQALKEAAASAGCAFWDARLAMGGEGAILTWRKSGLAQRDLVHLTGSGYQRLGNLLADTLLKLYDGHVQGSP